MKHDGPRADKKRMTFQVICPSLGCRKILELPDHVRGTNVTCRYCQMQFRVPDLRRPAQSTRGSTPTTKSSHR
jgi:hypothetical protein